MIKGIRHTGIVVNDLEASLYFYRDLLGLKIIKKMEESGDYIDNCLRLDGVRVTTLKMESLNGQMIELLKYRSHPEEQKVRKINGIGISHIAFNVDNLDKEYRRLKKAGVSFHAPPQMSPDGYAKVTFCMDPEGTYIELVELL